MYKYLPDYISNGIFDIDYKKLYDAGIRGLCFDIDNTLIEMHSDNLKEDVIYLMESLKQQGFKISILSNSTQKRTAMISDILGIKFVHRAFKPSGKGFTKVLDIMGLEAEECAMIGDQLFTDIKGGKKAGFLTIMTSIIDPKESAYVRFKRIFERMVMEKYKGELKTI